MGMEAVITALRKAIGQLSDPRVVRVLVKSLLVTLAIIAALAGVFYAGLLWLSAAYAWSSNGVIEAVLAALVAGLAAWFLFRIIAIAVLQFFADEIVAAVEEAHYPEAAKAAVPLPFRRDLANSLRGFGRTLLVNLLAAPFALVLLITGIGAAAVFIAVNAWLLGRELTDMAWLRHCGDRPADNPVPKQQRLLLGGIIAGIMLVPFAGFFAPVIGAAAGTHLAQGAMRQASHLRGKGE